MPPLQWIDPLELLDTYEAAARYGLAPDTMLSWRKNRKGPPYIKVGGRTVRYRTVDLEAWLIAQTVIPGDPKACKAAVVASRPAPVQNIAALPPHLRGGRSQFR